MVLVGAEAAYSILSKAEVNGSPLLKLLILGSGKERQQEGANIFSGQNVPF